jgi:hypothetical protein
MRAGRPRTRVGRHTAIRIGRGSTIRIGRHTTIRIGRGSTIRIGRGSTIRIGRGSTIRMDGRSRIGVSRATSFGDFTGIRPHRNPFRSRGRASVGLAALDVACRDGSGSLAFPVRTHPRAQAGASGWPRGLGGRLDRLTALLGRAWRGPSVLIGNRRHHPSPVDPSSPQHLVCLPDRRRDPDPEPRRPGLAPP